MSFFQILTLFNPQKDIKMQVGLRSDLIREAIQKKMSPPPLLLFFLFLKFHLKSMDFSLFLEGGLVSRKDHHCHSLKISLLARGGECPRQE